MEFCEKWWWSKRRAINVLDAGEAHQRHNSRRPYVAVLGTPDGLKYIVDISSGWVSIVFLDTQMRPYLRYDFKETARDVLFLKSAIHKQFRGQTDLEISSRIFNFDTDGRVFIEERNAEVVETRELETTATLEGNWESYPVFGDYSRLCTVERIPELSLA